MTTQTEFEPLARLVDEIADRQGIPPDRVARFADLLAPYGIKPEDITDRVVRRAQEIHRAAMAELIGRNKANHAKDHGYRDLHKEFGTNPLHLLRWFGADAWTLDEAALVAQKLGLGLKLPQIAQYLKEGRRGMLRADLTPEQAEKLYALIPD